MSTTIVREAERLRDYCDQVGYNPAMRGASAEDVVEIKRMFARLGVPLPNGLLDVYGVTMGIPQIQHANSILARAVRSSEPGDRAIDYLDISREVDLEKEGVLELGRGATVDLLMNRDGMFGLEPVYHDDGTVTFPVDYTFEEAFILYVEETVRSLEEEFGKG